MKSAAIASRQVVEVVAADRPFRAAIPSIDLLGVRFDGVTAAGAARHILDALDAGRGGVLVTPNLHLMHLTRRDPDFARMVREADLVTADGMPPVWASRLQGTPLPERVPGSDLIFVVPEFAARAGRSVYFLGGAPGAAEESMRVLARRYPALKAAGSYCPPMGFEKNEAEWERMSARLLAARPDIIFVALGSPKQEAVIERLRRLLPGSWWLGVGYALSFASGQARRAPKWAQRAGLEWIHRFVQEPRRLFSRYFVHGIPFAMMLFGSAGLRRLGVLPLPDGSMAR